MPFDPIQFNSPQCTDTANVWQYWIEAVAPTNINEEFFRISIDGINNLITAEALTGGSGSPTYSYRVNYISPDGFSDSFTFEVQVGKEFDCEDSILTPPAHDLVKSYNIGDPLVWSGGDATFYEVPEF